VGPPAPCEEPPGHGYDDASGIAGLDFVHRVGDLDGRALGYWTKIFGAGVVAADLDGDGHDDLYFPAHLGADGLFWGRGDGTFEVGVAPGSPLDVALAASTADFDGDARLDLLVLGENLVRLYRNEGSRGFAEVALPVAADVGVATTSAWADWDGDEDLDLFVGIYSTDTPDEQKEALGDLALPNLWLRNDGDAGFVDLGDVSPDGAGLPLHALFRDFDRDGDPDLLQVNDFGAELPRTTMLWLNDDGDWTDGAADAGLGVLEFPMGALYADLDGDQREDLWFSNIGGTRAFRGMGAGVWSEVSLEWAADLPSDDLAVSWSVIDVDPDGDGHPGVFLTYSPMGEDPALDEDSPFFDQPDRLLFPATCLDAGPFAQAPQSLAGPGSGNSRGVAEADFNSDGVPDLVVAGMNEAPLILNGRPGGGTRLAVRLDDGASANRFGIGARVTVSAGGGTWSKELGAGGRGSQSGEGPVLRFAMGDATEVDEIEVRWPDGEVGSYEATCVDCGVTLQR